MSEDKPQHSQDVTIGATLQLAIVAAISEGIVGENLEEEKNLINSELMPVDKSSSLVEGESEDVDSEEVIDDKGLDGKQISLVSSRLIINEIQQESESNIHDYDYDKVSDELTNIIDLSGDFLKVKSNISVADKVNNEESDSKSEDIGESLSDTLSYNTLEIMKIQLNPEDFIDKVNISSELSSAYNTDNITLSFGIDHRNFIETDIIIHEDFESGPIGITDASNWDWNTSKSSNLIEVLPEEYFIAASFTGNHGQILELEVDAYDAFTNIMREMTGISSGDKFTLKFDAIARHGNTGDDGILVQVETNNGYEDRNIEQLNNNGWLSHEFVYIAEVDDPMLIFNSHSNDGAGGILDNIHVALLEKSGLIYEDTLIHLDLSASLANNDGSETLSVSLSNIADGVVLSDGINSFSADAQNSEINITDWDLDNLTIMPPENFVGDLSVTANAIVEKDGENFTVSENITANILNENDPAIVANQNFMVDEFSSITFTNAQLLNGASDVDGDDLSVSNVSYSGADGNLTNNGDGSYTFVHTQYNNSQINIDFTVSDGFVDTTANVDLTVVAPPVVNMMSFSSPPSGNSVDVDDVAILGIQASQLMIQEGVPSAITLSGGIVSGNGFSSIDQWYISHHGGALEVSAETTDQASWSSALRLISVDLNGQAVGEVVGSSMEIQNSGSTSVISLDNLSAGEYMLAIGNDGFSELDASSMLDYPSNTVENHDYQLFIAGHSDIQAMPRDPGNNAVIQSQTYTQPEAQINLTVDLNSNNIVADTDYHFELLNGDIIISNDQITLPANEGSVCITTTIDIDIISSITMDELLVRFYDIDGNSLEQNIQTFEFVSASVPDGSVVTPQGGDGLQGMELLDLGLSVYELGFSELVDDLQNQLLG